MSEATPPQTLPRDAYRAGDWFDKEQRRIFSRSWTFAGLETDLTAPGQYLTVRCGDCSLFVLRTGDGALRAFHNICRHRGTELLEGRGEVGRAIVCPYHKWSYSPEGALLGVPKQDTCFPGLDKQQLGLHRATAATVKGMVFVHPDADVSIDDWLATLPEVLWPHAFAQMTEGPSLHYEMACNWKVFFENAIDGYHLAYLHKDSLGGPLPDENVWERHGAHMVWYSTEEEGHKSALPAKAAKAMAGGNKIDGAESGAYGGVYMLYPSTIVTASPYDFVVSTLVPTGPERTEMRMRTWGPRGGGFFGVFGRSRREESAEVETIRLDELNGHPMDSGDFMLEDLWICEKIQRSLRSPRFSVGPLARGAGGETPLAWLHAQVLKDLAEEDLGGKD